MKVQKIFSEINGPDNLYSCLLTEEELRSFSEVLETKLYGRTAQNRKKRKRFKDQAKNRNIQTQTPAIQTPAVEVPTTVTTSTTPTVVTTKPATVPEVKPVSFPVVPKTSTVTPKPQSSGETVKKVSEKASQFIKKNGKALKTGGIIAGTAAGIGTGAYIVKKLKDNKEG